MEVIGSPPNPKWVKISGVPLQAWRGDIPPTGRLSRTDPEDPSENEFKGNPLAWQDQGIVREGY